jgi:hypothetical protein
MILGKVAWCFDWLGQLRIKQVFVDVICLWPAQGNTGGIHTSLIFDYLSISTEEKWPTQVILENHGCAFTLMVNGSKTEVCNVHVMNE